MPPVPENLGPPPTAMTSDSVASQDFKNENIKHEDVEMRKDLNLTSNHQQVRFSYSDVISAIHDTLETEHLLQLHIDGWVVFLRKHFDCTVGGMPFQAMSFLLNLETGQYLARIWSKTIEQGAVTSYQDICEKLVDAFRGIVPCLGFETLEKSASKKKYLKTDFPYTRYISKSCQYVTAEATNGEKDVKQSYLCDPCANFSMRNSIKEEGFMDETDANDGLDSYVGMKAEAFLEEDEEEVEEEEEYEVEDDRYAYEDDNEIGQEELEELLDTKSEKKVQKKVRTKKKYKEKDKEKEYPCFHCDNVEQSATKLYQHSRKSHPEVKTLKCLTCLADVDHYTYVTHQRFCQKKELPNDGKPTCDICGALFRRPVDLKKHKTNKHFAGKFKCVFCTKISECASSYESHLVTEHPKEGKAECFCCHENVACSSYFKHYKDCKTQALYELNKEKRARHEARNLKCRHCDQILIGYLARKIHEQKEHTGFEHCCDQCDYSTHDRTLLDKHKKVHMGEEGKVCCQICGKKLLGQYLQRHIRFVHDGIHDNSPCDVCGIVFKRSTELKKHMNQMHSDDPKFKCGWCDLRFGNTTNKRIHEASHQEGHFACDMCGKRLKSKVSLESHIRIHTGEKPYK